MSRYCYEAVDSGGLKMHGTLEVMDQNEALRRIKEMGLFPTRIDKAIRRRRPGKQLGTDNQTGTLDIPNIPLAGFGFAVEWLGHVSRFANPLK